MSSDNPISKVVRRSARKYAFDSIKRKSKHSALDTERAMESESENFSKTSQEKFSKNERGSEDLMDMYEKGAFD